MKKVYDKKLITILVVTALMVFIASLEALIHTKSVEVLNTYLAAFPNQTPNDFMTFTLMNYLSNIFTPIIISAFLFFTYNKLKPNRYYSIFFGALILNRLVLKILNFDIHSIFYYILLVLYIVLLLAIDRYCNVSEV